MSPGAPESLPVLSPAARQALLGYARETLVRFLARSQIPPPPTGDAGLEEMRASFVTLRRRRTGDLRGCQGETRAHRPLAESVAHMAIASATDDARFAPVTSDELPALSIEINALAPMFPLEPDAVVVGRHGLLIVKGHHTGLLLPEVPVSYRWSRQEFLGWLCRKAGLGDGAWRDPDAELYAFESESWGEDVE